MLLVSDLALVQKSAPRWGLFFVADARTGAAVPQAHVVAKQFWWRGQQPALRLHRGRLERGRVCSRFRCCVAPGGPISAFRPPRVKAGRYATDGQLYSNDYNRQPQPDHRSTPSPTARSTGRRSASTTAQLVMRHDHGELKPAVNAHSAHSGPRPTGQASPRERRKDLRIRQRQGRVRPVALACRSANTTIQVTVPQPRARRRNSAATGSA